MTAGISYAKHCILIIRHDYDPASRDRFSKLIGFALLCMVLTSSLSQAQVTFSRDWNAGKRSLAETAQPTSECATIWRTVTNLCAAVTVGIGNNLAGAALDVGHLIEITFDVFYCLQKNIQHLTMCEARALMKNLQNEDGSMENNGGGGLPLFGNGHL
ncbi:hypothetical protein RP20_CCG004964 [Aedes albopictus]|nr:hypothetical protein RP20_CCG004964 [Aedes albopictus]